MNIFLQRLKTDFVNSKGLYFFLLACALFAFFFISSNMGGPDWPVYYSYLTSLTFDKDLLLIDEFQFLNRPIFISPIGNVTPGQNIGTAFFWLPFFILGHLSSLLLLGIRFDLGQKLELGRYYFLWINFGNYIYGLLGLFFSYILCRKYYRKSISLLATASILFATPFFYYLTQGSPNPHMPGIFLSSLFIFLWYLSREKRSTQQWILLGIIGGFMLSVRSNSISFLLLPLIDIIRNLFRDKGYQKSLRNGLIFSSFLILSFSPQMIAWKIIFGNPFRPPDIIEMFWLHPRFLETLFSSYHGLYFYSPILIFSTIGFYFLFRRDKVLSLAFLSVFLTQTYINSCLLSWWAGHAFGARYFLSLSPIFILSLAAFLNRFKAKFIYLILFLCLLWTVLLFLGHLEGTLNLFTYYTSSEILKKQLVVIKDCPRLLSSLHFFPKQEITPRAILALLSLIILKAFFSLPKKAKRIISSRILTCCALLLPLIFICWLLSAAKEGEVKKRKYEREGFYSGREKRFTTDMEGLAYDYLERANYFYKRGEREKAIKDLKQALKILPDESSAKKMLLDIDNAPKKDMD